MKKIVLLCAMLFTVSTFGKTFLETKFNYTKIIPDTTTGVEESNEFTIDRLRLGMKGDLNEQNGYYVRMNLLKINEIESAATLDDNATTANTADDSATVTNTPEDIFDYAYLSRKITNDLVVKFGKNAERTAFAEYVDYSDPSEYGNAAIGVSADYTIAGHVVGLNIYNGTDEAPGKKSIEASYSGSFADNLINPGVSYSIVKNSEDKDNTLIAAAAEINFSPVQVVAMYKMYEEDKASKVETNYMSCGVKYSYENFKPYVKYYASTTKTASIKSDDFTGYEVALEYYPIKDQTFNYHLVWTNKTNKNTPADASDDKRKEDKILAGITYNFDVL